MMPYFWQLAINPKLKIQKFGYVDFYAKIFLISTSYKVNADFDLTG